LVSATWDVDDLAAAQFDSLDGSAVLHPDKLFQG
jgi:hypothetical protein